MKIRGFASDNNSGVSPEVLEKMNEVNTGHVVGYGDDPYTGQAVNILKEHFGPNAIPFLMYTGTGANVLALAAGLHSFNSVICADTSHIYVDECGAPEHFAGCKLIPVNTPDGKLTPELVKPHLKGFDFEHHSQPRIISVSQSTEMGTVYSPEEIKALADLAHSYGLLLHVDGARLANAAVSLGVPLRTITSDAGIDILSFGGTKNGLIAAESVLFFNPESAKNFKYLRKQGMQLASKMRFIAAQFVAYFENDLLMRNAKHANEMAWLLYEEVKQIPQIHITQKVQANGVFAIMPKTIIPKLQKEYFFYIWNEATGEVRWMTSFDTTRKDIESFAACIRQVVK